MWSRPDSVCPAPSIFLMILQTEFFLNINFGFSKKIYFLKSFNPVFYLFVVSSYLKSSKVRFVLSVCFLYSFS